MRPKKIILIFTILMSFYIKAADTAMLYDAEENDSELSQIVNNANSQESLRSDTPLPLPSISIQAIEKSKRTERNDRTTIYFRKDKCKTLGESK